MRSANPFSPLDVPIYLPPAGVKAGLEKLLEGHLDAVGRDENSTQHSVKHAELLTVGMNDDQLHWLVFQECLQHVVETTHPDAQSRTFCRSAKREFLRGSCFFLTGPRGVDVAQILLRACETTSLLKHFGTAAAATAQVITPRWLNDQWELRFGGFLIKKFGRPADSQFPVAAALANTNCLDWIDNPFAGATNGEERLTSAIRHLNKPQVVPLIRLQHNGAGFSWNFAL